MHAHTTLASKSRALAVALSTHSAHAFSLGGLADATKHTLGPLTRMWSCLWTFDSSATSSDTDAAELSALLEGDSTLRTYPAYPHAPVVVGVASCQNVVLKWKSFDASAGSAWPVDAYVVQRFPDLKHRKAWATLLEANDSLSSLSDANVRPNVQYTYRVQAISKNVSSAYGMHQVFVSSSSVTSCGSGLFFGLLEPLPTSWSDVFTTNWSCEAVRTLWLIVICFLSVYALMRASVKRMQGTRSRSYRLKRIHKSAATEGASSSSRGSKVKTLSKATKAMPAVAPALGSRSSSESSTSAPPSEALDQSSRRSMTTDLSFATRDSMSPSSVDFQRDSLAIATAVSTHKKASCCQNCQKRFGIFRRRHLCDICQAVTLCRKCGYQAPADGLVGQLTRASLLAAEEYEQSGVRRLSLSGLSVGADAGIRESILDKSLHKVKIKTICRGCCEEVYRYSMAAGWPSQLPSARPLQH
ncbi:Phospholipid hydroperoxide glutathione peroxidase, partial [Globisporangium splendens]